MNIRSLIAKGVKWYFKHDREILKGVSMAASAASMVFAWKAAPKCKEILLEKEAEGASSVEKIKAIAPVVAPMVIAQGISIGANVAEYKSTGKKLAGLVNMVSSYKTLTDIKNEIEKQHLDPEQIKQINDDVVKKRLETVDDSDIEDTGHGDTLFIDTKYTGRIWRCSKDYFDLCIAQLNNQIFSCFDKYGMLKRDSFCITIGDIYKKLGLRSASDLDGRVYMARDYAGGLPISLVPYEIERNGKTELGYAVWYDKDANILPDDRRDLLIGEE